MAVLPGEQPTNRRDPMPTRPERGDAMPSLVAGDNNRGYHDPLQRKDKIFQEINERYNNGAQRTFEMGYHPDAIEGFNGPFAY